MEMVFGYEFGSGAVEVRAVCTSSLLLSVIGGIQWSL
jgi:hypothetical protein